MPTDIQQTNQKRREIGLREIKPEWTLYRTEFGAEDWKWGSGATSFCKRVQRGTNTTEIVWEEDYYYSGANYSDMDGTHWESMTIHYDYPKKLYFVHYLGMNAVFVKTAEPFRTGTTNIDSAAKASESILSHWKLSIR